MSDHVFNSHFNTRNALPFAAIAIALGLSACTNGSLASRKPATTTSTGDGVTTPPVNEDPGFVLSQVLRTATNPYTQLDLIGDGSGSFAEFCTTDPNAGGNGGASTCTCSYSYIDAGGNPVVIEEATVYREMDLIRCSYTQVPQYLSYVKVRIHHVGGTYSNEITLPLAGSGAISNLTDPSSFVAFKRYQCKDAIMIGSSLSANTGSAAPYDPIQSEDPRLTYPRNFYTTNYAWSLNAFTQNTATRPTNTGAGWICPLDPTKTSTSSGYDLSLYSELPLAGNYSMFPATTTDDRVNFVLPPVKTSVFNVPVNAYYAPDLYTSSAASGNSKAMGWGAMPIPNGDGTESCPDTSVVIPAGYQWVKVWQFRATLEPRRYRVNAEFAGSAGGLMCDPGLVTLNAGPHWIPLSFNDPGVLGPPTNGFSGCAGRGDAVTGAMIYNTVGWNHWEHDELMARYVATNLNGAPACFNPITANSTEPPAVNYKATSITAGGSTRPTLLPTWHWSGVPLAANAYSHLSPGSDFWHTNPWSNCGKPTSPDNILGPYKLCAPTAQFPQSVPGAAAFGVGGGAPSSDVTSLLPLDNGVSRTDFLLVVSPVNVHTRDFKDGTSTAKQYTPFRYYSPFDCPSGNPADPGCDDPDKMIKYGITFHDLWLDPDHVDGRQVVFPVCALQKKP